MSAAERARKHRWTLKRGDEVVVVSGDDKGRRGKILDVSRERQRVVVAGVNRAKTHQRPSQKNPQGGIVEREMAIHISNVRLWDASLEKATRVRRKKLDDGTRVRVAVASGETLED